MSDTNTELAAALRTLNERFAVDTLGAREPLLDQAAAALEDAESELTRRDTVITEAHRVVDEFLDGTSEGVGPLAHVAENAIAAIHEVLAAAPVSLEAVNPSAERVRDFCDGWYSARIHRDIAAATHSPDLVRLWISNEAVKTETTEETRVWYSFGVNSGKAVGFSAEHIVERLERETMGPVQVDKVERRTVTTSEWRPVSTEGDNRG